MQRVVWAAGMWLVCAGSVVLAEEAVPKALEVLSEAAESVEHLLKAAKHLEAAGLIEEAARIREQARERAADSKLLARKEAELQCLQEEVLRLRDLAGQSQAILVRAVVLDVDRAALRSLGLKIGHDSAKEPQVVHAVEGSASPSLKEILSQPLLGELQKQGVISILAEPTLITTPGRPASFLTGGQIPVPSQKADQSLVVTYKPFGTQFEAVPTVLPSGRIRLQARIELSERHAERTLELFPGHATPEISQLCGINTEVELTPGEMIVAGGIITSSDAPAPNSTSKEARKEREIIVLLTAELANGVGPRAPQEIIPVREDVSEVPLRYSPHDVDYFPPGPTVPVLPRKMRK